MKIAFYNYPVSCLVEGESYSFAIYLYQPAQKNRVVYHYPQTEIQEESIQELSEFESKGAKLQVYVDDVEEFLEQISIDLDTLKNHNADRVKMVVLHEKRQSEYENNKNPSFNLKEELKTLNSTNNYEVLRNLIRVELLSFPIDEDPTLNFLLALAEKTFTRDTTPVKCAVFSYFLAKEIGIKDQKSLAEIILASLLKDIGFCMIKPSSFKDWETLKSDPNFLKHPFLSLYYLSKIDLPFSKEVKRFIMEHHEDTKGEGFPRGKKEDFIATASFILNISEQIVYLSEGKMGSRMELESIFRNLSNQTKLGELNINMPTTLLNSVKAWTSL